MTVLTCDSAQYCVNFLTHIYGFLCVFQCHVFFFFIKDFIHWMSLPTNQNIELLLLKVICIFISVHEFIYFQLWTAADTEILTDWLSAWLSLSLFHKFIWFHEDVAYITMYCLETYHIHLYSCLPSTLLPFNFCSPILLMNIISNFPTFLMSILTVAVKYFRIYFLLCPQSFSQNILPLY